MAEKITADTLLSAYASGYFPMAESRDDEQLYWFNPSKRGVIPLDDFNIPRSLRKTMRKLPFTLKVDTAFEAVIRACATVPRHDDGSWINEIIIERYVELHQMGHAHSIESWCEDKLVGGLYGVSLGGAFFGESMFSAMPEASKMALVTLVEILREAGYSLLDTQFINPHLVQFGAIEITKRRYLTQLDKALKVEPNPSSLFSTISVRKGLATASSSSEI